MIPTLRVERFFRKRLWVVAIMLFLVALLVSIWIVGPAPPRRLVLATGEPEGAYAQIGEEYKQQLQRMGLRVTLLGSAGSRQNLQLLREGKADLALVQAGAYQAEEDPQDVLRALVAIQLEPVWVFYRGEPVRTLAEFQGRTIAIGQETSGTATLARQMLGANGITEANARLVRCTMDETRVRLSDGSLDVGFMVSSPRNQLVGELLRHQGIHLFGFRRQLAYSQLFDYLTPVVLSEGVLDLKNNVPPADVPMFATPTVLACRESLHPEAVEQILIATRKVSLRSSLVASGRTFPTLEGIDMPVHASAEAYVKSGESAMTRLLPYWGVWLLFKLKLLILPLLVIWLPFFRVVPLLYTFRVNRLLRRHYAVLREVEDRIEKAQDPQAVREHIRTLDELRRTMEAVSRKVPTHLQINVYQWRLHVAHVRAEAVERLRHLPQNDDPAAGSTAPALCGNATQNGPDTAPTS